MTYPDGRMVSYAYDSMNRMISVIGLDGEKTAYTYDANGRRVETASSSLTTTYQYDSVGNLLAQATSGLSDISFAYSYNKNGYITGERRIEDGKTTSSAYTYDVLGELTSFTQSTGYGESYSYDAVGNMLQKVIQGVDEGATPVTLNMKYNKGNQLTTMSSGKDKIAYSYDANGNMTDKSLTAKQYGKLTDTYAYNVLDQLTSYTGYDGYTQHLSYDANGMRTTKKEAGNGDRSTLEELLRGEIAGLPDIVEPTVLRNSDEATDIPTDLQWATTEYLYDITQEYYQVIEETTNSKNSSTTTAYAYGLERIAAYTDSQTINYVYDGRGSVVQAITAPVAGEAVSSALPDVAVNVQSFTYTAFGEQMGASKVAGFGYNAEVYDVATGMINLRARQYEPTLGRFSQKDIVRGNLFVSISLNRYAYVLNSPFALIDPSGKDYKSSSMYGQGVKMVNDKAKGLAQTVTNAKTRSEKEQSVAVFAAYCQKNHEYLRGNILTEYDRSVEQIKKQEDTRKKNLRKKNVNNTVNGTTRTPSDYILEACAKIMDHEFTSTMLNNMEEKSHGSFAVDKEANKANKDTNPSLEYTLDVVLQAYFEGWNYNHTNGYMEYGSIVCDAIDRLAVKAWRGSGKDLDGNNIPTIVTQSGKSLKSLEIIREFSDLHPGYLVYYALKKSSEKRESARNLEEIAEKLEAVKHMGMYVGELLLYDSENDEFVFIVNTVLHSAGNTGMIATDLDNPDDYSRFLLYGLSNQIDYEEGE